MTADTPATVRLDAIRAALDLLDEDTGMDGEPTPAAALAELAAVENALTALEEITDQHMPRSFPGPCQCGACEAVAAVRSLTKGDTA